MNNQNEILAGLDIATHEGWSDAMKRATRHLEDSNAIAAEHDRGPQTNGVPIIMSNEPMVRRLQERMKTYNEALAILLSSMPDTSPEPFTVDPGLVAELFATGEEPFRGEGDRQMNPVGVMALHEAAEKADHLMCQGGGSQAMGGTASLTNWFYVHSRRGVSEPQVVFKFGYEEGESGWVIEQPFAEMRESGAAGTKRLPIGYLELVVLAQEAAVLQLSSLQVWERVVSLSGASADD